MTEREEPVFEIEASGGMVVSATVLLTIAVVASAFFAWLDHQTYRECLRVHTVAQCEEVKP